MKRTIIFSPIFFLFLFSCLDTSSSPTKTGKGRLTTEKLYNSSWKEVNLPFTNSSLSIPFELSNKHLEIPAQVKHLVNKMDSKEFKLGKEFYILCGFVEYNTEELSLSQAADEAMANLRRQTGTFDLNYSEKEVTIDEISAVLQSGSYFENNRKLEFNHLIYIVGPNTGSIVITNKISNSFGRMLREKIIKSIIN